MTVFELHPEVGSNEKQRTLIGEVAITNFGFLLFDELCEFLSRKVFAFRN